MEIQIPFKHIVLKNYSIFDRLSRKTVYVELKKMVHGSQIIDIKLLCDWNPVLIK